jgi:hypothetical protein
LLLLITADLWHFGAKLVALDVMEPNQLWQDAKAVIGESDELVLPWGVSIADQNGSTEVGLRSAFGYQALEPRAMVAFTSHVADPRSSAYDILGARYVVAPVELGQFTEGDGALDLIGQQGAAWVYSRPNVLPVARLAQQVEVIADDAQAIARVHHPDFERASTVILNREPTCTPAEGGTATIDLSRPGYWRIVTESAGSSMLVLAESDFAGWQAAVDGEPASTYRAFTTVRAVCVPAGQHIVEWEYKPRVFVVGGVISMATALVGLVAVIMLLRTRLGPAGPAGQAASEQNDLSA